MKINWALIIGSIIDIIPSRPKLRVKTKKINVDSETLSPQDTVKRDWAKVAESWNSEF